MDLDIGGPTTAAATAARDALAPSGRPVGERGMAAVAERAIFDEALLAALKARVAEVRTVAK